MLLKVSNLEAGYGQTIVLRDVSVQVGAHEIVAIIGHNGAGKSTLLNAIYGVTPPKSGSVRYNDVDITGDTPSLNPGRGIGYSPQGGPVFSSMTVADNLKMAGFVLTDGPALTAAIERVQRLFPVLLERRNARAGLLSGGERQMLALGMLFVSKPKLVLLDEPSGGLSPAMVDRMYASIRNAVETFGVSVLLVEQDIDQALAIADRVYVLANGSVRFEGSARALEDKETVRKMVLGF